MERLPTPPGERPDRPDASFEPTDTTMAASTATATIGPQGIVTGWSEGARRLLGHAPSEILGQPATTLLANAGTGPGADETALDASAGREGDTVALRHRDGHSVEVVVHLQCRTTDDGSTEWLAVAAVPETPSTGSGQLAEWTFGQSPCALAIFDTDLRLVRANSGMEQALSRTEAEMRGLRLTDLAPGPDTAETDEKLRLALRTGEPQHAQARVHDTEHDWSVSITPLKNADGQVRAVCLTAHRHPAGTPAGLRVRLLDEARTQIGTTLDLGRTAQELGDVSVPRFADFTAVDLLDSPRHTDASTAPPSGSVVLRRAALRSVPEDAPESMAEVGRTTTYPAPSPPAECLVSGRSALYLLSADSTVARWADRDPRAAWLRAYGTNSLMVVPLVADGCTLGVALFGRNRPREPFGAEDLHLAEELTAQTAAGIHNARKYTRARTTTMALQRSLLPQTLPEQAALEIASRYLPATTKAGVGGDWFDVIPLSGARVALVVGDVVGHGMRASATMGRLRTAVRTLADVDLPTDELLTHLDDLVLHLSAEEGADDDPDAETAGGIGTTCLYAVYDPVSRRCILARAGHPPPAVVTPDGDVRFLDVPAGPPLGLGGLPFETMETELPEGSILALYTDGLLEARDHDIDEALDKMFAELARPAASLDTVCDRVLSALLTHRPDDDIALLVARTRALHADRVASWDLASDPQVVAQARKYVDEQLSAWELDDAAFFTELVVSELVTNAIRYGRPPIQLRLIHQDNTLISEVFDSGGTTPHMRRARTFDEGGRGLLLVAQLAQRWGTRHDRIGKCVWAEQSLT
ncbi:SpoIIE family protein phosphatase [Streptomyces sp. NPDC002619]|uniref:SpoIIE family protein phosphatase n=1 Tax=Streptomyces sp. NPDC002619 TaxID=3364655 RepID=UPI00369DBC3A